MGKPAAFKPGSAVVINLDSPAVSPNTKIHIANENEKISGEMDGNNKTRRSITTRRTAVEAAKPVKHVVLIPQFREIKPVLYNLKRSTVRRSERILDKLDHISEHGTPVRLVKRIRRQAAVKSASSNRKLFQEDEEEDEEGQDEGEGSTQSCSEERDDEEDELDDSTMGEDDEEVDESEEDVDESDEDDESLNEEEEEEEDEDESNEEDEEEEEASCSRTLRRARFLFTTSKASPSRETKKQPTKVIAIKSRMHGSDPKSFTLALSSFERKRRSELERIASSLGMNIAADFADDFTHVVVPKPSVKSRSASRRTMKVLSGLATGAFIVSETWLDACKNKGEILDSARYELSKEFPGALWRRKRGAGKGLLAGFKVLVRGNTSPSKHDLEHLVSLADGRIASSPSECDICVGPENYFREAKRMKKMFVADSALLNALQEGKLPEGITSKSRSS